MVAPWCIVGNMHKRKSLNYSGSLAEYKESAILDAEMRDSVNADAQRKTAQGLKFVIKEQKEAARMRGAVGPYGSLSPQVEKRLKENKRFLFEHYKALTDPSSVKVNNKKKRV